MRNPAFIKTDRPYCRGRVAIARVGLLRFWHFLCPARQNSNRLGTLEGQGVDFGGGPCPIFYGEEKQTEFGG